MRFHRLLPSGSSLEITAFFMNRSLASRMLMLGLPLLAVVLLLIFATTGSNIDSIVNRAITRNAQLQAQAMRLALEQTLAETRNQLLILAAGSMDPQDMARRLKFRIKAEGLRYREVAFAGLTPQNRYLLLNYDGEVINVPLHVALESPSGPFNSMGGEQRPGRVSVGQPLEAVYSMVPMSSALQNLSLYVLRFVTPVHNAEGLFQGYLLLSLDLREQRDMVSLYSAPEAPIAAGPTSRVRSVFFDRDGWMLFQSEEPDDHLHQKNLSTDAVRAGFMGNFGRPGFNMAFRPSPDHLNYWNMVADVQQGRPGQLALHEGAAIWGNGQMRVERVCYVPVSFKPDSMSPSVVLGGLAVLDTSFTTARTGMQLMSIYATAFVGGMLLLGLSLWWLARQMGRSLNAITAELQRCNEENGAVALDMPRLPLELERIKAGINTLLERLRHARAERRNQEAEENAQWQREPVPDLPHLEDLPPSGLVGSSPPMLALYEQVRRAAQVMADVLVVGETGTGKELVSEAIHRLSARGAGPFITINCGALDENLLMDTLFGHVKGAFSEARTPRKGAFLAAEGGTLMLDEVGNAAPKVQQALLRALSTRRIRPLGSDHEVSFDTRIIAATNAALLDEAGEGVFREDLYYRLAVLTIHTPPLRERKADIPALTIYFLYAALKAKLKAGEAGQGEAGDSAPRPSPPAVIPQISRGALARLMEHNWPGNVRELKNTLTRALTFCEGHILYAENIQLGQPAPPQDKPAMTERANVDAGTTREQEMPRDCPPGALAPPCEDNSAPPERQTAPTASPADVLADLARNGAVAGKLNQRLTDVWQSLATRSSVSRQEYQALAGQDISMRTAQYDLQVFVQLGLVRKEGRGPAQRYVVLRPQAANSNPTCSRLP